MKSKKEAPKTQKSDPPELLPQTFLYTTLQRVDAIKKGLNKLESEINNNKVINEIKLIFHKISGSSGVYGYPEVGLIARRAESRFMDAEDAGLELDHHVLTLLHHETAEMEKLLHEAVEQKDLKTMDLMKDNPRNYLPASTDRDTSDDRETRPPRILVVDDDETILEVVERYLTRAGYVIKTASNGKDTLDEVFKFSPDMVILDIMLPDIGGMELLKIIRQKPGGNILPIMFLTARDALSDRIQGLSIGGDDYITKPFFPEELVARVGALIARTTLLKELAVRDGLTGTFNHRYFYEKLIEEITRWKRYKRKFTLVIVDLDFFKNVNDTYGHMVGDQVLRRTAEFLKAQLRNVDMVARYGGEEFAIILPETDLKEAHLVLRRIYDRMKEWTVPVPGKDEELSITFSAGLATCPDDGGDERALVAHADKALYYAKENGRSQFILYRDLVNVLNRSSETDEFDTDGDGRRQADKGSIFVAEDDHLISNMLKIYLEKEGYRVRVFPNGAELLAVINLEKPDLMIMDVMMPLMDGLKALEIIKSQDDVRNIPVILLTSLDDKGAIEKHKRLGAVDYIQKPFDPGNLVKVIGKHIN